jgi:diguanylate cyclase (GGDEF)-like protein
VSEVQLFVFAMSFAQCVASAAMAWILFWYSKSLRLTNLDTWGLSFAALTLGTIFSVLNTYLITSTNTPADSVPRLFASLAFQFFSFLSLGFLGAGALETIREKAAPRKWIAFACAVAAFAVVLPFSSGTEGARARWIIRIGTHYWVSSIVLGAIAVMLFSLKRRVFRFPAWGIGMASVTQLVVAAFFVVQIARSVGSFVWLAPMLDFAACVLIAAGIMVWLIEEERERGEAISADLARLTHFDSTTGLANGALLNLLTQEAIERKSGNSLLIIDLDHFRTISDSLGREQSDEVFREVAARLKTALPSRASLARLKHDTYAALIPDSQAFEAETYAQNVQGALAPEMAIAGRQLFLTGSIGIALEPNDAQTPDKLMRAAQLAVNQCKSLGRGQSRFYAPDLNELADQRLARIADLRHALNEHQFVLHYQPIFGAAHKLRGFEALLRWQHPERGLLMPTEFVPHLEAAGIAAAVDQLVLRTAIRQIKLWRASGMDYTVAINVSAASFQTTELPQKVSQQLAELGVSASAIELEITESAALAHLDQALSILTQLKGMGVAVALDDFGTGYSSLSHLRMLPIHRIKIDRTFVRDIPFDRKDGAIVAAVIELAHSLELSVTAEGIESTEQRDFLEAQGVDLMQGYLLGKPMSVAEIEQTVLLSSAKNVVLFNVNRKEASVS